MKHTLIDSNEKVKATIGYGYVRRLISESAESAVDFISGGVSSSTLNTLTNINKTFGIVTDKRVYCFGNRYESINGKMRSAKGRKVIDIDDITGTSIIKARRTWMLVVGIILAVIALIFFAAVVYRESLSGGIDLDHMIYYLELYISLGSLAVCIKLILSFLLRRENYISVEYAGGYIRLKTYMESDASIESFQDTIIKLKDSVKGNKNSGSVELNINQPKNDIEELQKAQKMLQDGLINEEDYTNRAQLALCLRYFPDFV